VLPKLTFDKIYNLISQTDNRLATSTAEATRRIAEALQQDNAIMRCIAEDSNQVAILARRDSADMRVIAVVTLIFLPATFTAVSLQFHNFSWVCHRLSLQEQSSDGLILLKRIQHLLQKYMLIQL
jgi:hypothetical protein